ncbi:hypothetical protein [Neobacillus drentensis]
MGSQAGGMPGFSVLEGEKRKVADKMVKVADKMIKAADKYQNVLKR